VHCSKSAALVRFGSWLCENSCARRARRNISKKLRSRKGRSSAPRYTGSTRDRRRKMEDLQRESGLLATHRASDQSADVDGHIRVESAALAHPQQIALLLDHLVGAVIGKVSPSVFAVLRLMTSSTLSKALTNSTNQRSYGTPVPPRVLTKSYPGCSWCNPNQICKSALHRWPLSICSGTRPAEIIVLQPRRPRRTQEASRGITSKVVCLGGFVRLRRRAPRHRCGETISSDDQRRKSPAEPWYTRARR
jgi:hypothetical protein